MTSSSSDAAPSTTRRPFAARYAHRAAGIAWAVIGALFVVSGLSAIGSKTASPVGPIVIGLGLIVLAVYLLRGRGLDPKVVQRRIATEQRQAQRAAEGMAQALDAVRGARGGGATLVAYRNLWATARRFYGREAQASVDEALASISFDVERVTSPHLGSLAAANGGTVEVFRDWIVWGQEAHDVDVTTRGAVYVDGTIQVTSTVNPKGKVVRHTHDLRTAELQFTSSTWSMRMPVRPDDANAARRLVDQLAACVEELKPKSASVADIKTMVESILDNTGQPAAQRLTELSDLRFNRLLSDEEFERAKAKILGIE